MDSINWGEAFNAGAIGFFGCGGVLFALIILAKISIARGTQPHTYLLTTGVAAQAEIIESRPTRVEVRGQRVVEIQLEVLGPQGAYETILKLPVPADKIIQLQPGTVLSVKIDPNDQRKIALDTSTL